MVRANYPYVQRWLVVLLALLPGFRGMSGQDPVTFNQHLHNRLVYNPAFAGDRSIPGFSVFSRQQWLGWEGSPSSNSLVAHTRMKNKNVGLGVSLNYDRMGPMQHTGLTGAYSYSLTMNENSKLILGLQGEFRVQQLKLSQLQLVDQGDQLFSEDPGMKLQPNVGIGANYVIGKTSVHLAVPRLLNSELSPYQGESSRWSTTRRVLYLGATSSFEINSELKVAPSALLAFSRGNPLFMELSGMLYHSDRFGMGLFYRLNKTTGAMIRYNHQERIVFGYSFDVSFNITKYNAGTHEIYLGYNFPFNKTKMLSPRRF